MITLHYESTESFNMTGSTFIDEWQHQQGIISVISQSTTLIEDLSSIIQQYYGLGFSEPDPAMVEILTFVETQLQPYVRREALVLIRQYLGWVAHVYLHPNNFNVIKEHCNFITENMDEFGPNNYPYYSLTTIAGPLLPKLGDHMSDRRRLEIIAQPYFL